MSQHEAKTALLSAKLKLFDTIINNRHDGIVVFNDEFKVIMANTCAGEMLCLDKHEMRGKDVINFIPPSQREKHEEQVSQYLASDDKNETLLNWRAIECQRFNGTRFPAKIIINKHEVANIPIYIVTLRDLSHYDESKAKQYSAELELFKCEQMQKCMSIMLQQHFEKSLNRIAHMARSVKRTFKNVQLGHSMDDILAQSFLATGIGQCAKYFLRVPILNADLKLIDQTVKGAFDRLKILFEERITAKELKIDWSLPSDADEYILTDGQTIEQIFYNIIDDAIETTKSGVLEIKISNLKPEENTGVAIDFYCANKSFGIQQEAMNLILSKGKNANIAENEKFKFGGMCLQLANDLTAGLNGKMRVVSHPDTGTQIFVRMRQPLLKTVEYQGNG